MSNHLAIAAVSAVIRTLLTNSLQHDLADLSHRVVTDRPDSTPITGNHAEVRVYLYQVVENPTHRNADLPTRRVDGSLTQSPQIALDLHYLLSFFGSETDLEPQRLLGSALRVLHARPLLSRDLVQQVLQASDTPEWLKHADLADQIEAVRLAPLALSLEELSKLWMVFFQTKYTLSVAYQASVVLITTAEPVSLAKPVSERKFTVAGNVTRVSQKVLPTP
jgi:hypothetical protein